MDEDEYLKMRIAAHHPNWDSYSECEKERALFDMKKLVRYDRADRAMMRAQRTLDGYTNKSA